ncbi:serine proteinase stubble-like [Anopheles albimanus]|uniref:Uncharacterized protein n=1 Tax=Anopheles albimanus TaxID=7167 RepID=A0A182FXM9_ANOAL|nr:serine proteinase stubble-like [Anopheles albimanus]
MVQGCFKRSVFFMVLCAIGVSARSTGEAWSCTADDGSPGYWPPGCTHTQIEPRIGESDVNCTCITQRPTTAPKGQIHTSCTADDGGRGFWPKGCEHFGIGPRFGCSCIKLAECRNNNNYCVYQEDCAVPTFKLRDENCPLKDLVCCPKPSTREQITPYIGHLAIISFDVTTTASATSTDGDEGSGYIEEPSPSPPDNEIPGVITITTENPLKPVSSSTTDNELPVLTTATTETADATEKPLPTVNQTNVLPPVVISTTTPASNIMASDITLLSETFVYTACGKRAKDGLVPHKMRDEQDRAEYGEIPWMAAIFQMPTNDAGSGILRYCCNGALIGERAVMTTAHCVGLCGGNVTNILVRLGEWDLNSTIEPIPPKDVTVRKAHKHKDFVVHSLINNIAVLELASVVQYGPTIQPVCLPEKEFSSLRSREHLIFTGWGKTVNTMASSNGHNFLKSVVLRNNERSICKAEMKSFDPSHPIELHESFVCGTKVHEEQPCRGDAGAPVVAEVPYSEDRYFIHGLVSWGYECNRPDRPNTALTNIHRFRAWINKTLTTITKNSIV